MVQRHATGAVVCEIHTHCVEEIFISSLDVYYNVACVVERLTTGFLP